MAQCEKCRHFDGSPFLAEQLSPGNALIESLQHDNDHVVAAWLPVWQHMNRAQCNVVERQKWFPQHNR